MKNLKAWILLAALAGLTAGTLALADGGLFPTPSTPAQGGPTLPPGAFPSNDPRARVPNLAPDCPSHTACFEYFNNWRTSQIKRVLAALAEQMAAGIPVTPPLRCIHRTEAFGFQNTTGDVWRVNCLAQQNGTLTQLIDYELEIVNQGSDCPSVSQIQEWANSPFATNSGQANIFMQKMQTCQYVARPRRMPNTSPVNAVYLQQVLAQHPDVSAIVDSDRRVKAGGVGGGATGFPSPPAPRGAGPAGNPLGSYPQRDVDLGGDDSAE